MKVEVAAQVADFVKRLPPEPRRRLRRALRDLEKEKGDIKPLEAPLDGYCRLRVGGYRVVLSYTAGGRIQCVVRRAQEHRVRGARALALSAALAGTEE